MECLALPFKHFLKRSLQLLFLALALLLAIPNHSHFLLTVSLAQSATEITTQDLAKEIQDRRLKVQEFKEIAEMAAERGLRVFAFGGTSASLAHYIKWDLQRERGSVAYSPDRFDYEYTHIFRHNQDLDLVVTRADGTPESIKDLTEFEDAVISRFKYGSGEKSEWEVRGLKTERNGKEALLNNPDFSNQHTDSNSTGLIELTTPSKNTPIVSDLRDPGTIEPQFLKDVASGKLHYYFSPKHGGTRRMRDGLNPPILSVIRYLSKVFLYGAQMDEESLKNVREIVQQFDPKSVSNPYVAKWIEKNAKKLVLNAQSSEFAFNTLDDLGLRKKLIAIKNNPREESSLAWWLSREPLRSHPHPSAYAFPKVQAGRTANELGIDFVTHATKSYEAFESITRAPNGHPNFFISRANVEGEAASEGTGTYTVKGKQAVDFLPGFTIRLQVDPSAREGTDFTQVGNFIIWRTSDKLKVLPDPFQAATSHLEVLRYLINPANYTEEGTQYRLIRSASKIPWDEKDHQAFVDVIRPLIQKDNWLALEHLLPYSKAKTILYEQLHAAGINLEKLIHIRKGLTDGRARISLEKIGLPWVKTIHEFQNLHEYNARSYWDNSVRLLQGITINENLDTLLKLNPSAEELMHTMHESIYYVHHTISFQRKAIAHFKSPADFLKIIEPIVSIKGLPNHPSALSHYAFKFDVADDFLKLHPTPEQINQFKDVNDFEKTIKIQKKALHLVHSAEDLLKLATPTVPVMSPQYVQANSKFLAESAGLFFSLHPSKSEISKFMRGLNPADASVDDLIIIQRGLLTHAKTLKEFNEVMALSKANKQAEQTSQHAHFVTSVTDDFLKLNPTIKQINRLKNLNDVNAVIAIQKKVLGHVHSAKDFLKLATPTVSAISPQYVQANSKFLAESAGLFFSLHPSKSEISKFMHILIPANASADDLISIQRSLLTLAKQPKEIARVISPSQTMSVHKHLLKAAKTPHDFLRLTEPYLQMMESKSADKTALASFMVSVEKDFKTLRPTEEEQLEFKALSATLAASIQPTRFQCIINSITHALIR
jgi:hypothetical protein